MSESRGRFQVSIRTMLEVMALVGFLLALFYARRPMPAQPAPEVGRYRLEARRDDRFLLLDTATGQLWLQNVNDGDWFRVRLPDDLESRK